MNTIVDTTPFDPANPTPSHIDRIFTSLDVVVAMITESIEVVDKSEQVLTRVRNGQDHLKMMLDLDFIKADVRDKSIYTDAIEAADSFLETN